VTVAFSKVRVSISAYKPRRGEENAESAMYLCVSDWSSIKMLLTGRTVLAWGGVELSGQLKNFRPSGVW